MSIDSYQKALDFLYSLVNFESRPDPAQAALFDLRRMYLLLEMLGNPHLKSLSIHVAGTKGKGSTSAMIAGVLSSAGYKTGLYTSPHLIDVTERICVNGKDITRQDFTYIVAELEPIICQINSRAEYGELSTFEVLTAMGFLYFYRAGANFQVLETGMGGRLDATNVCDPEVAVITLIGLDHTAVLGNSLALIAAEKAGIIKSGCTVISADQPEEAARVIRDTCLEKEAKLVEVGLSTKCRHAGYKNGFQLFDVSTLKDQYSIKLPLMGAYQAGNLCCVIAALEELSEKHPAITREMIENGLKEVHWPGRFQVVCADPLVIIDGAHNPEAVKALMGALKHYLAAHEPITGRKTLVFGVSSDKDLPGMASLLGKYFQRIIVTRANHPRSMEPERIARVFTSYAGEVIITSSMNEALGEAMNNLSKGDLVLVTGSLFIAGDGLASFQNGNRF
ncbi:MAG: bifunctional folylpolyglutamate synthase/dihydrofolate synthase [Dehalococcoidales bacterium]|jgi:dihydrofolate synthase/folylpolyglutamate synthase|nr:bifunctional folylpolyglutamate synthase/dihydrofolate synthase [Dehalococcoidales bacterium]MDD3264619.1 bifunctional folylpolyglutamate synthase/dihydrofolate synthase [Dehalococcoidales bacterium]MDD4322330.1 bifunctional folylpolyglutamate synthase/dihydrofolate synthase [Dehalococcoidales bacterium]MDD4794862.1 bifunctional folylpolyglutamate synthase/dihydrofolate synthase [Dehalococcoidales bacterium]MDX9803524.1 folylpolyglutamate synthase/dihydrofolate synthase family protein [Dehal